MRTATIRLDVEFTQILELVKQLPRKEKIILSKELQKDTLDRELTQLLTAFKTSELSQKIIDKEVEAVRSELYAKRKGK